jgi:hypothetical protein
VIDEENEIGVTAAIAIIFAPCETKDEQLFGAAADRVGKFE